MSQVDLSVVIPVWNEEGNIGPLIEAQKARIEELGLSAEWCVVDAGSKDNTVAEARRAGAWVAVQKEPGYGGALRPRLCPMHRALGAHLRWRRIA